MNAGVALVQSYLNLNGYLTVTEFPVIRGRPGGWFQEVTDVDIMAVRFPDAGQVVPRGQPGPADDLRLETDPLLKPATAAVDVLVCEVKEGKARLNDATRTHEALYAALTRVGCVPPAVMERTISHLQERGEARVDGDHATAPARIRLMAFGEGESGRRRRFTVVSLRQVARFVERHLDRYHRVLHPADLADPVLGILHLLRKLD